MSMRLTIDVLGAWRVGLLLRHPSDPNAPRQEVQTTWPDGDPRVVLGFRGDTRPRET